MAYMYPGQKKYVYLAECHDLNERNRQMMNHEKTENFYSADDLCKFAHNYGNKNYDGKAFIHEYLGHAVLCVIADKPMDEISIGNVDSAFQSECYHEHNANFPLDYSHLQYMGDEKVLNDFVKDIRTAHKDADIPAQTLDNFELELD